MTESQEAQAASIRARLLNISREQQVDFNRMKDFTIYGQYANL